MSVSRYLRLAREDPERFAQRVLEKAAVRRARLVRRARQGAQDAIRAAAEGSGITRRGPLAVAEHLSVLDGWTLNLHAAVPPGTAGPVELVLSRQDVELRAPAELTGDRVTATVLLGAAAGGLPVSPGIWRIGVSTGPGRLRVLYPKDGGVISAGGGRPETGLSITLAPSSTGFARLVVAQLPAAAEVTRVRFGWDGVEIHGMLVGSEETDVVARFRSPRSGAVHEVPAIVEGSRFRVAVPLAKLGGKTAERSWELYLVPAGHEPLRVGRVLTDIAAPKRAFLMPQRTVMTKSGRLVLVRSRYTASGALVLACSKVNASYGAAS